MNWKPGFEDMHLALDCLAGQARVARGILVCFFQQTFQNAQRTIGFTGLGVDGSQLQPKDVISGMIGY